jgi:hypothetical protein
VENTNDWILLSGRDPRNLHHQHATSDQFLHRRPTNQSKDQATRAGDAAIAANGQVVST